MHAHNFFHARGTQIRMDGWTNLTQMFTKEAVMSKIRGVMPWHTWPRKPDEAAKPRDNSPAARFPAGAEWCERMRHAGYEPFVGTKHGRKQVFAKGVSPQRDKSVFAAIANEVDVDGPVRDQAIAYLENTVKRTYRPGSIDDPAVIVAAAQESRKDRQRRFGFK